MNEESTRRKVFISYCHTSPEHKNRVLRIATQLVENGIDVAIDAWDLKPGMDLFDFMEGMVKSEDIDKVLVLSDNEYVLKADNREGGVGAEAQILTPEVYENVKQTKVIPVAMSMDGEGMPARPKYLRSRLYIDFSTPDTQLKNYDQLVRAILDQPVSKKPVLGVLSDRYKGNSEISTQSATLAQLEAALESNNTLWKKSLNNLIIVVLKEIEVIFNNETKTHDELISVLADSANLRNVVIRSINLLIIAGREEEAFRLVVSVLEGALPNRGTGHRMPHGKDHYGHFLHILFLEIVACITQQRFYALLHRIISRKYIFKDHNNYWQKVDRDIFYFYGDLIDSWNNSKKEKHHIPNAHLHHEGRGESDIMFTEYSQADFLLFVQRVVSEKHPFWYPVTLTYCGYSDSYEIFIRADEAEIKEGLMTLFQAGSMHELVDKWNASLQEFSDGALRFYFDVDYNRLFNRDHLAGL